MLDPHQLSLLGDMPPPERKRKTRLRSSQYKSGDWNPQETIGVWAQGMELRIQYLEEWAAATLAFLEAIEPEQLTAKERRQREAIVREAYYLYLQRVNWPDQVK